MPSVNGFAELPATLVSELGCHVGIQCKIVATPLHSCEPTYETAIMDAEFISSLEVGFETLVVFVMSMPRQ